MELTYEHMPRYNLRQRRDDWRLTAEERKSIIPSSIFLKEKFKPSGEFDKLKARLVARGHRQHKSINQEIISASDDINIYNNKFTSPTVNI
jgi:hypothetical protein